MTGAPGREPVELAGGGHVVGLPEGAACFCARKARDLR